MGRYYQGDIEGKFWFGVQSSDDADFFGVEGQRPEELSYNFEAEDIEGVKEGVKRCEEALGKYRVLIDTFFEENGSYNDEELSKFLEVSLEKLKPLLESYARLRLGKKILAQLEKEGYCHFTAEC